MSDNTSTNLPSMITADETTPITDSSANVPFFKKKSKTSNNRNIRKRKKSDTDVSSEDNNTSAVITKERKLDNLNPFVQASKKGRRVNKEEISDVYAANKSAITSVPEDIATRSAEWDTETDRDAQALLEKKLAAEEVSYIFLSLYSWFLIFSYILFRLSMITSIKERMRTNPISRNVTQPQEAP